MHDMQRTMTPEEINVHTRRDLHAREVMRRLGELIHGIRTAMLTTVSVNERQHLRSRPMATQESEIEDELWFYIDARSSIVDDITENHQINLAYVDPAGNRYVTVSGVAQVLRDPDLLRKYWSPRAAEWFPDGPDNDRDLALLRVQFEEAEYWDVATSSMVKLRGLDESDEREVPVGRPTTVAPPVEAPSREA